MSERLYKRGRIWWTWFYDAQGKRQDRSTRCRDRRAARAAARRLERAAATGADHPENQATLSEAVGRFRVDRRNRGCAPDTLRYYDIKLRHVVRLLGGASSLSEVDPGTIDDYVVTRLDEGASRHTVAKELGALRGVLRLAHRRGEYATDPRVVLPEGWSSGYVPRKLSLTQDEARALVLALRPDRAAHVAFLFVSGASWGPSCRSRRADWDLDRSLVLVRGTKNENRRRVVPIFDHVADLAERAYAGAAKKGPAYAPWGNVRRDITAACKRADVPRVSPNDCRRSASTWLVESGAPSHLVAYFLGHSSSRMVEQVYGRVDGAALARSFASVGIAAGLQRDRVNSKR